MTTREDVNMTIDERYEIRGLTSDDADELAQLHVTIWRDTYTGLIPQEKLDGLDPVDGAKRWRAWLTSAEAPRVVGAFDRSSGALVGWICIGKARDDDAPADVELQVLNLGKAHHGTGLAHELMTRELGDQEAYLWVVDGNERAQAFYRKHGFELDGVGKDDTSGSYDLRMVRSRG